MNKKSPRPFVAVNGYIIDAANPVRRNLTKGRRAAVPQLLRTVLAGHSMDVRSIQARLAEAGVRVTYHGVRLALLRRPAEFLAHREGTHIFFSLRS